MVQERAPLHILVSSRSIVIFTMWSMQEERNAGSVEQAIHHKCDEGSNGTTQPWPLEQRIA
jgi:hypothetical protein